ncbi:CinA family protein [Rothia santali]|nr:nicotinamide-nucleotide amidohydrolase family protein [Rothia santali]
MSPPAPRGDGTTPGPDAAAETDRPSGATTRRMADAAVARLAAAGESVATAESLTAGLLAAAICDVPGASAVFPGGIVSYAGAVKASLLGVDEELLAARGSVDPDVAGAMAEGARVACGAVHGISTTGVAGPSAHDGKPVGRVYLGLAGPGGSRSVELDLAGDRAAIRARTVELALGLLLEELGAPDAAS